MSLYQQNMKMAKEAGAEGAHIAAVLSYLAAADSACCEPEWRIHALTAAAEYATGLKKPLDRQVTARAIEARNGGSELSTLVQTLLAEQQSEADTPT